MFVWGLNLGFTVKYKPLPPEFLLGFGFGTSYRQRVVFDCISLVSSYYTDTIKFATKASKHKIHHTWFVRNTEDQMITRLKKPTFKPACGRTE